LLHLKSANRTSNETLYVISNGTHLLQLWLQINEKSVLYVCVCVCLRGTVRNSDRWGGKANLVFIILTFIGIFLKGYEHESVCFVCVCVRARERVCECVCVCVFCVCFVCVWESERERDSLRVCVWVLRKRERDNILMNFENYLRCWNQTYERENAKLFENLKRMKSFFYKLTKKLNEQYKARKS